MDKINEKRSNIEGIKLRACDNTEEGHATRAVRRLLAALLVSGCLVQRDQSSQFSDKQ